MVFFNVYKILRALFLIVRNGYSTPYGAVEKAYVPTAILEMIQSDP
jgi:hypothetical protein